jgi:hypothetical protein
VLPDKAKQYFDSLIASASADASMDLASRQKAFERQEFARGQTPGSTGFKARLAALYGETLTARAHGIADALIKVHSSFDFPLEEAVDAQLLDWGARALADAYSGLEGAYSRHLSLFGVDSSHGLSLDHVYALARVTVDSLPRRHLWELRNVPAKRPQQAASNAPVHVTIHNTGTIGAVQTGSGSIANVRQQWVEGDTTELKAALAALRSALERSQEIESSVRCDLVADVDSATVELGQKRPNTGKLLRWLGGIGTVIGTVGSVQPAYEAVRSVARALGLPL